MERGSTTEVRRETRFTGKRHPAEGTNAALQKYPAGMSGAQVSVSRYSPDELEAKSHDADLVPSSGTIHLHIDASHMGVGGDSSWEPRTHTQYRISPKAGLTWSYALDLRI